jgi:hypothetical protein
MEHEGWVSSKWGASETNRKAKLYSITRAGRKRLAKETEDWQRMSSTIDRFLGAIPDAIGGESEMSWPRVFVARLRGLFIKGRMEEELDDEIRFHLEMQAEDNRHTGMTQAEARRAAMRGFGGIEPMKERFREQRTFGWTATVTQDISHGLRLFRRRSGFTIAAILSLAMGIGLTVAIFMVLNAVALRPLPYADADRLIWMTQTLKKNITDEVTLTAHFREWRRQNHTFSDLAGYNFQTRNLTGIDEPLEVASVKASASLLPILGVQPILGRNFLNQEDYRSRPGRSARIHIVAAALRGGSKNHWEADRA